MSEFFRDTLLGNGATDVNLEDHPPSDPHASGVTAWEYNTAPDSYVVASFGGMVPAIGITRAARLNAPFNHADLQVVCLVYQSVIDDAGHGTSIGLFMPDTAIGGWDNKDYLQVNLSRAGAELVIAQLQWYKADGTTVVLASGPAPISFPGGTALRLIASVQYIAATDEYVASIATADALTGTDITVHATVVVPAGLTGIGHDRIGAQLFRALGSSGIYILDYSVAALPVPQVGADATGVVPFPFRFNWPIEESFSFATNVLVAADQHEQRIPVRNPEKPRRLLRALLVAIERDEAVRLMALLFSRIVQAFGVPLWQHATALRTPAAIDDTVLDVEATADRDLVPGRLALLWRSFDTWEPVTIQSVTVDTVTIEAPITLDWRKGTTLLPLRLGRLGAVVPLTRHGPHLAEFDAQFLLDAVDAIDSPGTTNPLGGTGTPTRLAMAVQPAGAVDGEPFTTQPVVRLGDGFGHPVSLAGVPVTVAIASGGGILGGTLTVLTDPTGAAAFPDLLIVGSVGDRTLAFTSPGLAPTTSAPFFLAAGPGDHLGILMQPSGTVESTEPLHILGSVVLLDVFDNPVPTAGIPITVAIASGGGILSGTLSVDTDVSGESDWPLDDLIITGAPGLRRLIFSAPGYTPVISDEIDVTVHVGPKAAMRFVTRPPLAATSGVVFSRWPVLQLVDAAGNDVAEAGVSIDVVISLGGGTLSGTLTQVTDANGRATFDDLAITGTSGDRKLTFSSAGLTDLISQLIDVEP